MCCAFGFTEVCQANPLTQCHSTLCFLEQAVCKISVPSCDWLYISQEMVTMATPALTRIAPLTSNILFTVLLFFPSSSQNSAENVFIASLSLAIAKPSAVRACCT